MDHNQLQFDALNELSQELADILATYVHDIESADTQSIESVRVQLLGKNGTITNMLKELASFSIEEKQARGKQLNILKTIVSEKLQIRKEQLESKQNEDKFDYSIALDKTMLNEANSYNINLGSEHIIPKTIARLNEIFKASGFEAAYGPDIETSYYNFEALNIPLEHPARDNNDTFYMHDSVGENEDITKLLRTHTTTVQIRLLEQMKNNQHDMRSYSIGRVYRNDTHDATHACSFHQIEGIIIEDGVTMQHLKGFLEYLLAEFFERKCSVRFRPSYFPFTEPSCEADIYVKNLDGKLEVTTSDDGKPLELGGCGIIHPSILDHFNMHGKQAFAFGFGLERVIMIKYGITNLHDLYNNYMPVLNYVSQG